MPKRVSPGRVSRRPGRPSAGSLEARDKLLVAALELFAQHGVAGTTFAMIAKRARLTPAMVHYYFQNRERLLDAVVDERLGPVVASIWNHVPPAGPPADLIRGVVARFLDGIERTPWVPSIWIREVLNEDGALRTRLVRHIPFHKIRMFSAAIQRQQRARRLNRDIDPELIVFSILALVMVHCASIHFWAATFQRRVPTRKVLERHITSLLLNGLRTTSRR